MKKKISDLKVAELRVELERRGLDSKGLKGALVQRLQKAVEEEGDDTNEVDTVSVDVSSPKATGRRSGARSKRSQESESEDAQDSSGTQAIVKSDNIDAEETVPEKERGEDAGDQESEVNGTDAPCKISQPDVEESQSSHQNPSEGDGADVGDGDATPTRDEEEDVGSPGQYYEEEYDRHPEEDEHNIGAYEGEGREFNDNSAADDGYEEAGNEFQHNTAEEDGEAAEYQVEEEMEEDDYRGEQAGDDSEMVTVEEEMAEPEESDAGEAVGEETEVQQTEEMPETEDQPPPEETTETEKKCGGEETEIVTAQTDTEEGTSTTDPASTDNNKSSDEKMEAQTKCEQAGKEEVVSSEVDVLDMLDYDLELTGEQTNINTQSDEQSAKGSFGNVPGKVAKGDPSTVGPDPASKTSDDHKLRPKSDSSKPSSSESPRAGSQSSSKSGASGKDGGKPASSGKREGATLLNKEENSNRNLWISGLSSTTRASELKSAFSRYGKVVGAKVVTNVKSPGSKCFGYVTMATADAASKCILHLNNTEMHGRMITVEIAKGDPSASSKKSTASSGTTKKESENKDSSKAKDADMKASSTSSRRQSSSQSSGKDGEAKDGQDRESAKKPQDGKSGPTARRTGDDDRKGNVKSPTRSRSDRTSTAGAGGIRTGDKRHGNRSPGHNRSGSNRIEPERKRARPADNADRKVVMDSNKGELRVNVSRNAARGTGGARWESDQKPKPLLSRRRSTSPLRRRSMSPLRGGRGRGGRGGRGGMSRLSNTYEDRTVTRPGARAGQRDGPILSISQLRAQHRDRARNSDRMGRGGLSRGDLSVDRERLRREREERDRLRLERERLERERRQLEKDRQERERLETERLRLEQERKRELERIEREKAEMRRLQEITRYEVEQRQRAIKRTYDDDLSHRGSRGSREGMNAKRSIASDRSSGRQDARRDRDDTRRGYDSFSSRSSGQRNGPNTEPPPPGTTDYRSRQQGSFRDAGSASKPSAYHDNRARPQDREDSRYTGSSASTGTRNMDKYERRSGNETGGRTIDYSHGYERGGSDAHRRGAPTRDARDGRKVVRDRSAEQRGVTSPEYRRQTSGRATATARIEITREQSPPARRARRDSSPASGTQRAANWREGGKSGRDTSRRGDDRDLREQIRGGRQDSYSDSNRDRSQRRGGSRSPTRTTSQYSSRWPEGSTNSSQTYSATNDGNAIPTTGRSSGSTTWGQQWQQGSWSGTAIQAASTVGRQVIPPYGTVPSASTMITPGSNLIPATQGYLTSSSERQSRSFQGGSYNKQPIQRRF